MNDLDGLDWTASSSKGASNGEPAGINYAIHPAVLRPIPSPAISGRSTPLPPLGPSKPATPVNDSFASLVAFKSAKANTNVSLQERQKQIAEQRARQEADRKRQYDVHFGQDSHFWEGLESRNDTPNASGTTNVTNDISAGSFPSLQNPVRGGLRPPQSQGAPQLQVSQEEDDLLAAFSSSARVDRSSHMSLPAVPTSGRSIPASSGSKIAPESYGRELPTESRLHDVNERNGIDHPYGQIEDDDPFGLGQITNREEVSHMQASSSEGGDDDDILGILGKPASTKTHVVQSEELQNIVQKGQPSLVLNVSSQDQALAELVDMGFAIENARRALERTERGCDVQAAVGVLLNEAHEHSRQQNRLSRTGDRRTSPPRNGRSVQRADSGRRTKAEGPANTLPAWMRQREDRSTSNQRRQDSRSPASEDRDVSQYATEVGSTLLKSANSLWRAGQRKVQKAVAELREDGDASQPKWMREAHHDATVTVRKPRSSSARPEIPADMQQDVRSQSEHANRITEEAMMLESGTPEEPQRIIKSAQNQNQNSAVLPERHAVHASWGQRQVFVQQQPTKITREQIEEESSQAYISPARRKKPSKALPPEPDKAVDLFNAPPPVPSVSPSKPLSTSGKVTPISKTVTAVPPRPKPPSRRVPYVAPSDMSLSHSHRQAGNSAFKRGDYDAARTAYTNALRPLPTSHPLAIILLTNRSLTALKTGDAKASVADADEALALIGPSQGEDESITLGPDESEKPMRESYGKALMRKAEALEHMEKWADAAAVWRSAVEAGIGGSVSIQGRNRCERIAAPQPPSSATPTSAARKRPKAVPENAPPRRSALTDLSGSSSNGLDAEAVQRLRAANAAADRAEDEKFVLSDAVDAKLATWRSGKSDNLRALLGSLDSVLWPAAGWNKVGMNELVMPNKVKIVYMKAIGKVHPDKIPQTATTEQRMISGAVFSTLNEAWDKFKRDNGL